MLNQSSKTMINHRQIAQAILRGRRFLKALKVATDAGPITQQQIQAIAKAHQLDTSIPEGFIVSGLLAVYELPEPAIEPESVVLMEPGKLYLAYWKQEPDDEVAYTSVMASRLLSNMEAYGRFMKLCNLPEYTQCLRCDELFASRLGKKFCCDNCRKYYHAHRNEQTELTTRQRTINFLKSIRNLIHSL